MVLFGEQEWPQNVGSSQREWIKIKTPAILISAVDDNLLSRPLANLVIIELLPTS